MATPQQQETEATYWPEEGTPDFVSDDEGRPGSWHPLCTGAEGREHAPARMTYRFTPWGSWHCGECGMVHLIWAEDWPDAEPDDEDDDPDAADPERARFGEG